MADIPTFLQSYVEFVGADPSPTGIVAMKFAEAQRQTNIALAAGLADDLVYLLTAQKLARTPFGVAAELSAGDGKTVYDDELTQLREQITSGRRNT